MRWEASIQEDVVVVPVHNEEASIGMVIRYLLEGGFKSHQLIVVNSGCTDRTIQTALDAADSFGVYDTGSLCVVDPHKIFQPYRHVRVGECGLKGCRGILTPDGKGAAMYAAALKLTLDKCSPNTRVFFLDGDITNAAGVDPIGCLLKAWQRKPACHIAKLSSAGRENEGVLAFINTLPPPYNNISELAWPLCGQQALRLGDLQQIPFAANYSIEVCLLSWLVKRYGSACFSQEPINVPLTEERHFDDLQRYTRMYTRIMLFLTAVISQGGLDNMAQADVCGWNHNDQFWRNVSIGIPSVLPKGSVREVIYIDEILPPIKNLIGGW